MPLFITMYHSSYQIAQLLCAMPEYLATEHQQFSVRPKLYCLWQNEWICIFIQCQLHSPQRH